MSGENLSGKGFVASFSGGKDSVLAVFRAINAGLVPIELLTAYKADALHSWYHGMTAELLKRVSGSLEIPLTLVRTESVQYNDDFEDAFIQAKAKGAEVCVFGDIDIEGHLQWGTQRCENAGLIPFFPHWGEDRKKIVYEFIDSGFLAIIKIVDTTMLPESFLGQTLSREVADEIAKFGADVCGENGEYHTFVYDGPLFSKKVGFTIKEKLTWDKYAVLDLY